MNRFPLAALTAIVAAAWILAGCEKEKESDTGMALVTSETPVEPIPPRSFQEDLKALTASPHRLAGYEDGSIAASKYVEGRLRGLKGLDGVYVQSFPVVQAVTTECRLFVDGQEVRADGGRAIYPVRPNILLASVTPEEGLSGSTVYAGKGEIADFGNDFPKGRIVVLDFDCDRNWMNAFALGARAVIFLGQDAPAAQVQQHINVPANLPRFYLPRPVAEKLELTKRSRNVTIKAACQWRGLQGRSVIAVLRGENPASDKDKAQAVVLAAPLDSYSEVPELSAGARDAGNCAALLQIAEYLAEHRPRRDTIFCFFDGQAQNHLGARAFYGAVSRDAKGAAKTALELEERLQMIGKEALFRQAAIEITKMDDLFQLDTSKVQQRLAAAQAEQDRLPATADEQHAALKAETDNLQSIIPAMEAGYQDALRMLQAQAEALDGGCLEPLRILRIRRSELEKEAKAKEKDAAAKEKEADRIAADRPADAEALRLEARTLRDVEARKLRDEMAALEAQAKPLEAEDMAWNHVQRGLNNKDKKYCDKYRTWFDRLIQVVEGICKDRLQELREQAAQTRQAIALKNALGKERNKIVMHVSVNLGDARDRWSFQHGDDSIPGDQNDPAGNYGKVFAAIREIGEAVKASAPTFDGRSMLPEYDVRWFAPGKYVDSGDVARLFAVSNLSVMTTLDRLASQGQPIDTPQSLDQDVMRSQASQLGPFLKELLGHEGLGYVTAATPTAWFNEVRWIRSKPQGPIVFTAGAGAALALRPVPDAVVAMTPSNWAATVQADVPGFVSPLIVRTNRNGNFEYAPYSQTYYAQPFYFAAEFNTPAGVSQIDQPGGSLRTGRGLPRSVSTAETIKPKTKNEKNISITLTQAKLLTLVGYGFNYSTGTMTLTMRGQAAAAFQRSLFLQCEWKNVVTVFAPMNAGSVKFFNTASLVVLNNRNDKDGYQGVGVPLDDPFSHPVTPRGTAHDLLALNDFRLGMLRNVGITQESLEILSSKARDLEEDARKIAQEAQAGDPASAGDFHGVQREVGAESASAAYSRSAYKPLVSVINDLVTAVVLLLLLAMPFAYALERLLIGTPHIYRQIGWFALFFLVTFAVLYFVNPAFRIAATPIIIFLAFTIILLSSLVIFIMVRKLQSEIKKIQGLATTVHSADVSRLSTMMAAVNMGISTMRRRPIRTLLTAVTVVLLTFTILTFASFGASWGLRETYSGPMSDAAPRILVRHQLWSPVDEGIYDRLCGYLLDEADVVPRWWVSMTATEAQAVTKKGGEVQLLLCTGDLKNLTPVAAAIGVDIRDLKPADTRQKELRDLLDGNVDLLETDGIFLTSAQRKGLGLGPEDVGKAKIVLAGVPLTYAGQVKDELATYTMLDGSSVLPVDYQASGGENLDALTQQQKNPEAEFADVESARFVPYGVDKVVVIPAKVARDLNGQIRSLSAYPLRGAEQIQKLGASVAHTCELPAYVGERRTGVQRMLFTSLAQASGWRDLLIPVILGGLIVFATMLGSVSDREREIYTFSSLGLAPPHIASLFFAEASMYAVVGGMGGYLLGQIITRLLRFLSDMGLVSVPIMNYSSTNAIVTIVIVMCTVLVSTIYPALKASRSANPGVQRAWRIPKPQADLYDLVFPFTVSTYDIVGVASFLREHFENYSDAALGVFATMRVSVFRQRDNDMLGLHATVALAPFDLGVTQNFTLLSRPSEIEGIDEVRILIYRLSGAQSDWQRSNRVFINDLRKQLLIWRSLTSEVMERYRQKTLEQWAQLPVEDAAQSVRQQTATVQSNGEPA